MTLTDERRAGTLERLGRLREALEGHLGRDKPRILREDTCIYVVGSGGRGEMSEHSDVDLFVARVDRARSEVDGLLTRIAIARAFADVGLPDPSQGGDFLKMHTATDLCDQLGRPEDDASNTFTARMLLLLESAPLLGDVAYDRLLARVVEAYWKDAKGREAEFQPYVLVNDVVRYWRSLLLNYVAKNVQKEHELKAPEEVKRERRLRSYKLRFSRCMTCFSLLATLLDLTRAGGVTREQVVAAVKRTPVERLRALGDQPGVAAQVAKLLGLYATFLRQTDVEKRALMARFGEGAFHDDRLREGDAFGEAVFDLLQLLAKPERARTLFRYMVV